LPHPQREGSMHNNGERLGNIWKIGESLQTPEFNPSNEFFFKDISTGFIVMVDDWVWHWKQGWDKGFICLQFQIWVVKTDMTSKCTLVMTHCDNVITLISNSIDRQGYQNCWILIQSSWRGWPVILYSGSLCKTNEEDTEIHGKFSLSLWNWALTFRKELQKPTCQILHQSWLCSQRSGRKSWQDKRLAWSLWRIRKLTGTKICTSAIQACWQSFSFKIYHDLSFKANKKL
jgi:hypothetical protein